MDVSLNSHNQDSFLEQFPLGSFLQGRFWKHFLDLQGRKNWQLNVYDNSRLIAHCLLYTTPLFFGKSYLYSAKGPLMIHGLTPEEVKEAYELILSQIRDITIATRKREEIFCRLEPNIAPVQLTGIPRQPANSVQPKATIYLELDKPADTLFASFKEKTRYNIRLAEKKGLQVFWSSDDTGMKIFLQLMGKTMHRQKIRSHDRDHYRLMLRAGKNFNAVYVSWAEYQGKPIAANFYIVQHPTMTYVHGGFDYKYRNLMAPYLLQWEAVKFAQDKQLNYYDFWGVAPADGTKENWDGFTRFKMGFGGTVVESPGCFDFIYNQLWYNMYARLRTIRSKIGI